MENVNTSKLSLANNLETNKSGKQLQLLLLKQITGTGEKKFESLPGIQRTGRVVENEQQKIA